jgi:hypothetical protein
LINNTHITHLVHHKKKKKKKKTKIFFRRKLEIEKVSIKVVNTQNHIRYCFNLVRDTIYLDTNQYLCTILELPLYIYIYIYYLFIGSLVKAPISC